MRPLTFLSLSALAIVVTASVACSTVFVDAGHPGSDGGSSPAPSGTTSSGTTSAHPSGVPGAPPSCALTVGGALTFDVPDAAPQAHLWGASELDISCAFTRGDIAYTLVLEVDDLHGPATYTGPRARLDQWCLSSSCPGAFGFSAYAPDPTCTIALDAFAPETRGGMLGSFSCPKLLIDDFLDESDMAAVTIQGSFAFPPAGDGELADAGPGQGADAGPPTCSMEVSAPFATGALGGEGYAISGQAVCVAAGGGVSFELDVPLDAGAAGGALLLDGASFCSASCREVYETATPCELHVLDDQGVNGHFAAQIHCPGMVLDGIDAAAGPVDVIATIDGIHEPTPPPD